MTPTSVAEWTDFLVSRGVAPGVAALWASTLRPHVQLVAGDATEVDTTPARSSKFGGQADMPAGMAWPTRPRYKLHPARTARDDDADTDAPVALTFLAQINLADVAGFSLDLPLPTSGLLLFFYDVEHQPWGFDTGDAPGSRVVHVPGDALTVRCDNPGGTMLRARPISMRAAAGFPAYFSLMEAVSTARDFDENEFSKAYEALEAEMPPLFSSRFGGYSEPIQGEMELECQLVSNGIYCGDSSETRSPEAAALAPGFVDWRLLLQLREEFEADGVAWGDSGCVYFWCRHQDIASGQFDKGWTVLQCF
jgi:uncharacterized protein YwqG